jgi:DNA-binding response OmpR family regulator
MARKVLSSTLNHPGDRVPGGMSMAVPNGFDAGRPRRLSQDRRAKDIRLLIVEGEPKRGNSIRNSVENEQYQVVVEGTRRAALRRLKVEAFAVILLDLILPDADGFDILRALRGRGVTTPVVVITARDTLKDRVTALDSGADDYLVKPFMVEELNARIRALLRRAQDSEPNRLIVADLEVDVAARQVTRAGQNIDLTTCEFELTKCLIQNKGRVVTREALGGKLRQGIRRTGPLDNNVDVHIARLRRKIDAAHSAKLIHTVRGVGFIVRKDPT